VRLNLLFDEPDALPAQASDDNWRHRAEDDRRKRLVVGLRRQLAEQ
jgi:hypothetical protein